MTSHPSDVAPICSDLVSPQEFLQMWNVEALECVRLKTPTSDAEMNETIARTMGISDETAQELAFVCGKESLLCGMEPKKRLAMLEMRSAPPRAEAALESLRIQIEERNRRSASDSLRFAVTRRMKYNILDEQMIPMVPEGVSHKKIDPEDRVPVPNVILTIQITKCLNYGEGATKIKESETYNVLSCQPLTALRDKLRCSSDAVIAGDFSNMPDIDPSSVQKAGDIYKSSYFFIENVFYNDLRLQDNQDYSKNVIKWAKQEGHKYVTAGMEETTFNDLKFRLGQYYLFVHQGNCEHAVVFLDMRLFSAEDSQDICSYPMLTISRMRNRSVCQGCNKLSSRWIVQGAPILPTDPCFLCKSCFKSLLYDKEGKKTAQFKAYLFSDFYTGS